MLIFLIVIEMMKTDSDIMVYSLWVLTVIGVLAGLIMAVTSAVFAVINSAITPISALAGIPGLYFWNISASKYIRLIRYILYLKGGDCDYPLTTSLIDNFIYTYQGRTQENFLGGFEKISI